MIFDQLGGEPLRSAVLICLCCARLSAYGTYWFWRAYFFDHIKLKILCTRSRFLCLCMCVALLCGKATLSSSDFQASALALVAPPVSVFDLDHHGLAIYCWYCGSASAGLVLRICAFVYNLFS